MTAQRESSHVGGQSETISTEAWDGWTFVFTKGTSSSGDTLYHSVQLFQGDQIQNRITVSRRGQSTADALDELRRRCRKYVIDYSSRSKTDPGESILGE